MMAIDIRNLGYALGSEIEVSNEVIERLVNFYGWNEDKVKRHIESDVEEMLDNIDDENGTFEDKIMFAKEDNNDAESYESIAFDVKITKNNDDVTVTIE